MKVRSKLATLAALTISVFGIAPSATASTTYTTGNSCTHNGIAYVVSVTWTRSGNYERPVNVSWHSIGSVWNFETQWRQNSRTGYVTESYYDQRPTFAGSVTYPSSVISFYWPGYDVYELVSFYGPYGGSSLLCTVKVTDPN